MSKKEFLKAISFSGSSVGSLISGTLFLFGTWAWGDVSIYKYMD